MKKPFYITTAIVYPNSRMHLGFAWEVISCDMVARFKRLNNYDVFFTKLIKLKRLYLDNNQIKSIPYLYNLSILDNIILSLTIYG